MSPRTCCGVKIIANLPYNIGTVLLFNWLKISDKIESMHLMLQKEVVQRIVARPNENHYGRLAVMVNFLCETKMLFTVSPTVFTPQPKVTSAIVQIIPRAKPLENVEFGKLEKVVAAAFNQRRKMLRSSLKSVFKNPEEVLKEAGIKPELRAENLTIEEFCKLAEKL
jgi:16S rRNA (adenine1518-N6/adenine1519-N6)-dimethyltransferase